MNYFVVIEKGEVAQSFGAYVPDLPGCVATGSTREQVRTRIRSAIAMHLEGMREDGIRPPKPSMNEFDDGAKENDSRSRDTQGIRTLKKSPPNPPLIFRGFVYADSDRNPNENCGRDLRQPR